MKKGLKEVIHWRGRLISFTQGREVTQVYNIEEMRLISALEFHYNGAARGQIHVPKSR